MPGNPDRPDEVPSHAERDWLLVTLSCIGDAVITTDFNGNVTLLNPVAESLTGWTQQEAHGVPLTRVFTIVNEESRQPVESPSIRALREGVVVGLGNHTRLLAKDGRERVIDNSAAPIRNAAGQVVGVVLIFRHVTERRRQDKALEDALAYAENIIATMREPFVVLDKSLRVRTANASFYRIFHVSKKETENHSLFELGNHQWDNPRLRQVLGEVLTNHHAVRDFEVAHVFPTIGRKVMLLNAHRVVSHDGGSDLILLAIEDVTERRRAEQTLRLEEAATRKSEVQYRRFFESARDGILILEESTGKIIDANPFMSELLGYELDHFLGKELWEIGLFKDIAATRAAFQQLQVDGYIRYDHLPLETREKKKVEVEVVSNTYEAGGRLVIQCNIRDCSERFHLEQKIRTSLEEKEVLLKEVHHRVKNNLQVISSLLHLQSQHTQDLASVQMFRESQDRVRSMALVHERLYRSRDLAQVDFKGYIESLATHLFSSHQVDTERIKLAVDVHGVKLAIDAAIPCGLLLNELISNCLKHAFPGTNQGRIRIELQPVNGGEILLSVGDDGVGLPPDIGPLLGQTFGMQLIADLVDQLHGSVQVDRDAGTTVRIVFPTGEPSPAQRKDRV
jgi:PAS domain S-box-containing protein